MKPRVLSIAGAALLASTMFAAAQTTMQPGGTTSSSAPQGAEPANPAQTQMQRDEEARKARAQGQLAPGERSSIREQQKGLQPQGLIPSDAPQGNEPSNPAAEPKK